LNLYIWVTEINQRKKRRNPRKRSPKRSNGIYKTLISRRTETVKERPHKRKEEFKKE
jgi:hypothetical protein|tara:strand:- start:396 stop:566 length:171 start_codon:yes stop_codon:yes gene_type:complete